jgi:ribosomal protein S18 acetylase RimI-like enzyme
MKYQIRDFQNNDSGLINKISLIAFSQYKNSYTGWLTFSKKIANMSSLAEQAELIIATVDEKIAGAVAYVPPGKIKNIFPTEWAIIRMLVVDPNYRGLGIGKALTTECIQRAIRDTAPIIGLHTSPMMDIALEMYLRMGFQFEQEVSPIHGVPYNIYIKRLTR